MTPPKKNLHQLKLLIGQSDSKLSYRLVYRQEKAQLCSSDVNQ